jgi:hypothetical protein
LLLYLQVLFLLNTANNQTVLGAGRTFSRGPMKGEGKLTLWSHLRPGEVWGVGFYQDWVESEVYMTSSELFMEKGIRTPPLFLPNLHTWICHGAGGCILITIKIL